MLIEVVKSSRRGQMPFNFGGSVEGGGFCNRRNGNWGGG
jgi:hypothetical protein